MIYLYTTRQENDDWILQNDLYFNLNTGNQAITDRDREVISVIDSAKVTAENHIQTKYGLGTIRDLSSGCKTYLNVIKNPDKVVSAEECGANVLELLFRLDDIHLYMSRPERFSIADDTKICFNDREVTEGRSGYEHWWSEEYRRRAEDDL